jgi:hypothetical protein
MHLKLDLILLNFNFDHGECSTKALAKVERIESICFTKIILSILEQF